MIKNIRHKGLKRLYEDDAPTRREGRTRYEAARYSGPARRGPRPQRNGCARFPAASAQGDLKGFWSVTVRANWRVIFRFVEDAALDVDYVDYH